MLQRTKIIVIACLLSFGLAVAAHAEFSGVSGFQTLTPRTDTVAAGGDPNNVARSLAHGFPLWYTDTTAPTPVKIAPCLDFGTIIDPPANITDLGEQLTLGAVNAFCFGEAAFLNPAQPVSFNGGVFPENFPEVFTYYTLGAELGGNFNGPGVGEGLILVEMGLNGGFVAEIPNDGEQIMFADTFVRLRNMPAGTGYQLETPYATYTFDILGIDVRFSQSVGVAEPPVGGDYLSVLAVAGPAEPVRDIANLVTVAPIGDVDELFSWRALEIAAYDTAFQTTAFPLAGVAPPTPGVEAGVLDEVFSPILNAAGTAEVARQLYVAVGQAEPALEPPPLNFTAPAEQPVFDSAAVPQNVTLTPPALIDIGPGAGIPVVITGFSLQGKLFNDGPNTRPAAAVDAGFAAASASSLLVVAGGATLDVSANDLDDPSGANVHGIHPGSALPLAWNEALLNTAITSFTQLPADANGALLLASSVATEMGGSVRRAIDRTSGQMQFMYTPPPEIAPGQPFVGDDRIMYVVQDRGGLISDITQVTIRVESVNMTASYRAKTGRWSVSGSTSEAVGNTVEIFNGATIGAGAVPVGSADVAADGTWKFESKLPFSPDGAMSCRTANGVALLNIPVEIR